jgi:prepilin-type N-terminal cleavage/methylation domain-containing protein
MRKKGFSLIELLVSSALIFFLLTGTAQLNVWCHFNPRIRTTIRLFLVLVDRAYNR